MLKKQYQPSNPVKKYKREKIEYDPSNGKDVVLEHYFVELLKNAEREEECISSYFHNKNFLPKGLKGEQRRFACMHHFNTSYDDATLVVECQNCDFVGFPCANCANYILQTPNLGCT